MTPELQFALTVIISGILVWSLAVAWSRWDMRRAIIKDIVKMRQQEEAIRRLLQK